MSLIHVISFIKIPPERGKEHHKSIEKKEKSGIDFYAFYQMLYFKGKNFVLVSFFGGFQQKDGSEIMNDEPSKRPNKKKLGISNSLNNW